MKSGQIALVSAAVLVCGMLTGCQQASKPAPTRMDSIGAIVERQIAEGNIPGAVVLVGRNEGVIYHRAFGDRIISPERRPTTIDTVYDLASMTKPIATATAIHILVNRGLIDVDDYVVQYLPQFGDGDKQKVRIRHLLTHTSGLPAYTNANSIKAEHGDPCPDQIIEKICSLKSVSEPGEEFRYSCLGYITLARIVAIVAEQPFDRFCADNIFGPLRMTATTFNPPQSWTDRIAATEVVDGVALRGTVHDPLARLAGGVSGNAGLFSTAEDLGVYCQMLLSGGEYKDRSILSPRSVTLLTTAQSHGRAYGFDIESGYSWIKGDHASPSAFCHSGYTGTSIVCDRQSGTYLIILTNRAHPDDSGTTKPLRTQIANLVFGPDTGEPTSE